MKYIAVVLSLLLIFSAYIALSQSDEPHSFEPFDCAFCHVVGQDNSIRSTSWASDTCLSCHTNLTEGAYMHPVDVTPNNVAIASGFPLSEHGLITCGTCHDVHAPPRTPFGGRSFYLRSFERGKMFCDQCHAIRQDIPQNSHQSVLSQAHFQAKESATSIFLGIDPVSKTCLSCHDGSLGSSVALNTGVWQHQSSMLPHDGGSHPIGMDYENARLSRGAKTDLRPAFDIDPRISFFDGRVGCGSCHNPFSRIEKSLVMSNRRSALCLACHALDGRFK